MSTEINTLPATMPEPLQRAVRHLTQEVLHSLQEVVTHTQPDSADWMRMPCYRLTDAADTLNLAVTALATYLREVGVADRNIASYLQLGQQHERAVDSQRGRDYLNGLFGRPGSEGTAMHMVAQLARQSDDDPTARDTHGDVEAVLYAFRFARAEDADEWFADLSPAVADRARRIAAILAEGSPAPTT